MGDDLIGASDYMIGIFIAVLLFALGYAAGWAATASIYAASAAGLVATVIGIWVIVTMQFAARACSLRKIINDALEEGQKMDKRGYEEE